MRQKILLLTLDVRRHSDNLRRKCADIVHQRRLISMRDDFKTIYGYGVVKTDFTFPAATRALTE